MAADPQALVLTFLGEYLLGRGLAVASASVTDVLGRVGVSTQDGGAALARMVDRGLLRREHRGDREYLALTPRCAGILEDGRRRLRQTGPVNRDWDGTWTLLSLPPAEPDRAESRRALAWAGFGPLRPGLWLAAGTQDAGSAGYVFHARTAASTDVARMIRAAYDLDRLAARYEEFLARWGAEHGRPADPMAAKLRLVTDWLQIIRYDPRLPVQHLPADWPAIRAQDLFDHLDSQLLGPARAAAAVLLDTVPDPHH